MYTIKKITKDDFENFFRIANNAYPGFGFNQERFLKHLEEDQEYEYVDDYGCFDGNTQVGNFSLHHFTMNYRGTMVPVEGIGAVAVDLLHKKRHVCKAIIDWFCEYTRQQGSALAALYPFRPDFYYKMGFGYGPQHFHYQLTPAGIPRFAGKDAVRFLTADDIPAVEALFTSYAHSVHGMFIKREKELAGFLKRPNARAVGYFGKDGLEGYAFINFKKASADNALLNNLDVMEWVYTTDEAMRGLLAFLGSQADQVPSIILNTFDPQLYHLLNDVRNGSGNIITPVYHESNTAGVGLMYKIVNPQHFITTIGHLPLNTTTLTIGWDITDSFSPQKQHQFTMSCIQGKPALTDAQPDVTISCDITTFSSIWMGALSLDNAMRYGRLTLSNNAHRSQLNQLFAGIPNPQCLSWF
jgi:predicted acetyltransferase